VTDYVALHRVQEQFFNSRVQASLGLASVHCSHSYLDINLLGPGQCMEPVCLELRKSGVFTNKNIAPNGKRVPNCNLPLSSLELFALMSSYKSNVGKETMAGMCEVLSKGTDLIDTNVARVRRPCSFVSSFHDPYSWWWVWCLHLCRCQHEPGFCCSLCPPFAWSG
jgi:hypothetical protein